MSPEEAKRIVQALKERVNLHEPAHGMTQWYIDEFVIDCDSEEFWRVIERALMGL